jgi:hypothetical protein
MTRKNTPMLLLCLLAVGFHSANAWAEDKDEALQLATLGKIVKGAGKPGDTATSKNGEVVYVVLEGGIVEIRNMRYNTSHRYNIVKPRDNK